MTISRVKGKNSVCIDWKKCNDKRLKMGMTTDDIAAMCGRTGGWFAGLRDNKTTINAAMLLAKNLGFEYDDIVIDPNAPKTEEAEQKTEQIDITGAVNAAFHNDVITELKRNTEELSKVQAQIATLGVNLLSMAGSLTKIAAALEAREPDLKAENVKHAEAIIKSMTQDTGEMVAEKYNRACEMRSINEKERVRALDNLNCQYQWRTTKSGGRMCYVVRGC